MKMHYAGGLRIEKNGRLKIMLEGWASCATGDRAYKIRDEGNQTIDEDEVTCGRCIKNMRAAGILPSPKITVCANCLRASCWQGIFYCDEYKTASTIEKTLEELESLKLEHPSYWKTETQSNTQKEVRP